MQLGCLLNSTRRLHKNLCKPSSNCLSANSFPLSFLSFPFLFFYIHLPPLPSPPRPNFLLSFLKRISGARRGRWNEKVLALRKLSFSLVPGNLHHNETTSFVKRASRMLLNGDKLTLPTAAGTDSIPN